MYLLIVIAISLVQFAEPISGQNDTFFTPTTTTNFMTKMVETARTIDIGAIDFDEIISRLVSPTGLVTQFALELEIQIIFTLGWIVLGRYIRNVWKP